jgi:hypothetical protein
VDVGGVAGEEDRADPEPAGHTVVHAVTGEPVDRIEGQPEVAAGRVRCSWQAARRSACPTGRADLPH